MRLRHVVAALSGAAALALAGAAGAAEKLDFGRLQYDSNCASCHGRLGKGDGPFAGQVDARAGADITTLARRNGGVFPFERVYEIVDGREEVRYHGPREMPIWGDDYRARAAADYGDAPYDPEAFVRLRIVALVDYVYRLQAK